MQFIVTASAGIAFAKYPQQNCQPICMMISVLHSTVFLCTVKWQKMILDKEICALNMIGESSRKVIDAMSDIVWTINPDNDSFERIILRMRSLAYNLLRAKNIEFIFKADETLNNLKLSLEKRRNFYPDL